MHTREKRLRVRHQEGPARARGTARPEATGWRPEQPTVRCWPSETHARGPPEQPQSWVFSPSGNKKGPTALGTGVHAGFTLAGAPRSPRLRASKIPAETQRPLPPARLRHQPLGGARVIGGAPTPGIPALMRGPRIGSPRMAASADSPSVGALASQPPGRGKSVCSLQASQPEPSPHVRHHCHARARRTLTLREWSLTRKAASGGLHFQDILHGGGWRGPGDEEARGAVETFSSAAPSPPESGAAATRHVRHKPDHTQDPTHLRPWGPQGQGRPAWSTHALVPCGFLVRDALASAVGSLARSKLQASVPTQVCSREARPSLPAQTRQTGQHFKQV